MENSEKLAKSTRTEGIKNIDYDYLGLIVNEHNLSSKRGGYAEIQKSREEIVKRIVNQILDDLSYPEKKNDAVKGLEGIVDRLYMH